MNKDKTILEKRREYVKKKVWKAESSTKEIKKLANKLFLSERQVWRDLQS